jgi:hypothetical protein
LVPKIAASLSEQLERSLLADEKYSSPQSLMRFRQKTYSQFGQDGIIAEIFRRIGGDSRRFVEIGTEPTENNTNLLLLKGWSGLWIDGALPDITRFRGGHARLIASGTLAVHNGLITRENVLPVMSRAGFGGEVDFIGIDIDYNTFHIFDAVASLSPRLFSVEYNAQFPADLKWVAQYAADQCWDGSMAYGASLASIEERARAAGFWLVGCELSGTDAFFVREDLLQDRFLLPGDAAFHWEPLRLHLDQRQQHRAAFPASVSASGALS